MNKKALVILADGFEEIEASTPIDVLRRADIEVTVAGLGTLNPKGAHGLPFSADKELDEIDEDYNACILPGGLPGAENLAASEKVSNIIKRMNDDGKIIAAICASPAFVLVPSGILSDKAATGYPGTETRFTSDIEFKQDNVVVSGNIITSRGPATALPFSFAIVEQLIDKQKSGELSEAMLFQG